MATATNPIREKLNVKTPEEAVPYLNLLVYGEPGAGKTYLTGTALDHKDTSPVLMLDVEGGAITLRKRKNLDVVQIREMRQIEEAADVIYNNPGYYKTVIIDSLTELQKLDMRTVQKMEKLKQGDKVDIDVPSQRAWGKSGERIRRTIAVFKDLPCHVIATCLLASDYSEEEGYNSFYPSLPGKLRADVPGYFDVVGLLKAESKRVGQEITTIRTLQVTKTQRVVAKDRTGALGLSVIDPNIPDMWSLIHSS